MSGRSFNPGYALHLWLLVAMLVIGTSSLRAAPPVEFEFKVAASELNPFVRELWAEVALPSGRVVSYPAFYAGENRFAVRVRADVAGTYRLGKITESRDGRPAEIAATVRGPRERAPKVLQARPPVFIDPASPQQFILGSGERFVPLGANLAWATGRPEKFYPKAFASFSREGLNWTRVWMAHWGGLNLDWLPEWLGATPAGGELSLVVAESWDKILDAAEQQGVYLQLVLQHHGQYSSQVNSNWQNNPWNAANGGFLKSPVDFFTSPEALRLTLLKYRYIVARWGYSPAIMSWELFNEVHWTDALRGENKNEEAVARWHAAVATYLRSIDRHGHLIVTSTEDLRSPVYAGMDYYQPHLYVPNLMAGVRRHEPAPDTLAKPVFHGEMGDDHLPVSEAVKKSGNTIVPPVWASVMGQGSIPAQAWLGGDLIAKRRLGELGAVSRFMKATGIAGRAGLVPCSMVVECKERVPLVIEGGQIWHQQAAPEMDLPLDGRMPLEMAVIPRIFMNQAESPAKGYPSRATYRVKVPEPLTLRFRIGDSATTASAFRFSIDGVIVAEAAWPELPKETPSKSPRAQPDIVAALPAGEHVLVIENPSDAGWFDLTGIDCGLTQPVLAAVGKRNADFAVMWLWHRTDVFALKPGAAVTGTLVVDDVSAGRWQVTWWDTFAGHPATTKTIEHAGGALRLPTPPIQRHTAVVIERAGR